MAKPRIFVSSTYYDLKHIRTSLESFINSFGYEPVLFESGDIFFSHEKPLDESCYAEIQNSHMQILIIGGSYGSADSSTMISDEERQNQYTKFNSITRKEFEVAYQRKIPIYFFVENGVLSEYNTYKKNRDNKSIKYAHVSSVNIFLLLDEIFALQQGNFVQGFTKFEDISDWLKPQWAHLMAEFISNRTAQIELENLTQSVEKLNSITSSLKVYTEAILNKVEPKEFQNIKTIQEKKLSQVYLNSFTKNPLTKFILKHNENLTVAALFEVFKASEDPLVYVKQGLRERFDSDMDENLINIDQVKKDFYYLKGALA